MTEIENKIVDETAKLFNISLEELINYSGQSGYTTAFEACCYLLRTTSGSSLSGISSIFVNQSIGDVLEAIKHVESQLSHQQN